MTLAEQIREALRAYRAHEDAGRDDLKAQAYSRLVDLRDRAQAAEPTEKRR